MVVDEKFVEDHAKDESFLREIARLPHKEGIFDELDHFVERRFKLIVAGTGLLFLFSETQLLHFQLLDPLLVCRADGPALRCLDKITIVPDVLLDRFEPGIALLPDCLYIADLLIPKCEQFDADDFENVFARFHL